MSLIPMLFSDWWEDLDRPHRLWDQHFGMGVDPESLLSDSDTESLVYRPHLHPHRRHRRRYHPFLTSLAKKGRGTSTVQPDKNKFQVTLDVAQFAPEDVTVKVVDNNIVVEAKHEEKEDEHGWVSRQFVRKYIVPTQCDIEQVETRLSSDGILIITAPRKHPVEGPQNERLIKVQFTGRPAISDTEPNANCPAESHQNQQTPQTPQRGQQVQQQQQQQNQRGRKTGGAKS